MWTCDRIGGPKICKGPRHKDCPLEALPDLKEALRRTQKIERNNIGIVTESLKKADREIFRLKEMCVEYRAIDLCTYEGDKWYEQTDAGKDMWRKQARAQIEKESKEGK